jgi:two-component system, chemotaxis family, sensor kinase Cph1
MTVLETSRVFDPRGESGELQPLALLDGEALDDLPFGAIRLSRDGTILGYNRFESRLTGLHPSRVIGRNFFTEVAPCTNVQEFAGRFRDGIAKGELHAVFPYVFNFNPPRQVTVTLYFHKPSGNAWVLVKAEHL